MTKDEMYNELTSRGLKPKKNIRFCKIEELEAELAKSKPAKADTPQVAIPKQAPQAATVQNTAVILPLRFETSGWCKELKTSYYRGVYHARTLQEYETLKPYAVAKWK